MNDRIDETLSPAQVVAASEGTAKHTRGPWVADRRWILPSTKGRIAHIACCLGAGNEDANRANARLIAAAPELLSAAKAFIAAEDMPEGGGINRERYVHEFNKAKIAARAAIAKAEGRQP